MIVYISLQTILRFLKSHDSVPRVKWVNLICEVNNGVRISKKVKQIHINAVLNFGVKKMSKFSLKRGGAGVTLHQPS